MVVFDFGTNNSVCAYYKPEFGKGMKRLTLEGRDYEPSAVKVASPIIASLAGRKAMERVMIDPSIILYPKNYINGETEIVTTREGNTCNIIDAGQALFMHLKKIYEVEDGEKTLICYPSYFNDAQVSMLIKMAEKAGLNVWGMVEEPIAAIFGYLDMENLPTKKKYYRISDIGAGTHDVAIIEVSKERIRVMKTFGAKIGGDDLDYALQKLCLQQLKQNGMDIEGDVQTAQRLKIETEQCKIALSNPWCLEAVDKKNGKDVYGYKFIIYIEKYNRHCEFVITEKEYHDEICQELWKRMHELLKEAETYEKENKIKIDTHLLIGGTHCEPYFVKKYKDLYETSGKVVPYLQKQAVAVGGAIYGHLLEVNDKRIKMTLGIRTIINQKNYCIHNYIFREDNFPIEKCFYVSPYDKNSTVFSLKIYSSDSNEEFISESEGMHIATYELKTDRHVAKDSQIKVIFRMKGPGFLEVEAVELSTDKKIHGKLPLRRVF